MALYEEIENGSFVRATDEEIVAEEKLLIENLSCHSTYVSDHITNLLQELEGKLPENKAKMQAAIDRFQKLTPEERTNFRVGRRVGAYARLDDLIDGYKHEAVEQVVRQLTKDSKLDEKAIYGLMERFI
jgi:hypothetical protein